MRNKIGMLCMFLGTALLVGALSLFMMNQEESIQAGSTAASAMPQLVEEIQSAREQSEMIKEMTNVPVELLTEEEKKMTEIVIDGYAYIGYLSFPVLDLELPIMADWDYTRLRISPCRYYGTVRGEDLVLMAHNYVSHFGRLSELTEGDSVSFTDMDGVTTCYEVVGRDVLAPYAVEEMVAGDYDLTLFTCTYGGASRVTVYCDRTK